MPHRTKLTDPKFIRLIEALKSGNYMDTACLYAGLVESTVYRWIKIAEEAEAALAEGVQPNEDTQQVMDLAAAVKQARAEAETRNVFLISKAANEGTWQAAAWWLERTAPRKWGRYVRTEVSGPDDGPVKVSFTSDDLESLVDQILTNESD